MPGKPIATIGSMHVTKPFNKKQTTNATTATKMKTPYAFLLFFVFTCLACSCQPGKAPAVNPEHRFEFTNCEAFYNGQKLPFMQPLSEWVKIFGPYDTRKNHFFTWHNIPMDVAIKDYQDSLVVQMSMQFGKNTLDDNDSLNKFKGSILINNLPFWKGVVIEKFNSQLKKDPSIPVFLPSSYTKFNRASICADSLILVQTITLEFSDRSNIKRFDMWVRYQLD